MQKDEIHIIFLSDTHLGFDYPIRPRVKRRRRGEEFFRNFEYVLSFAKTQICDLVIHGGDLFFRSKIPQLIIDRVYENLLSFVSDSGIPIYIVPGNHERSQLPTSLFLNHPLIHIFSQPKIFFHRVKNAKILIGGFPFIRGNIDLALSSILKQTRWYQHQGDIKILALHQAIEGAIVGPGEFTFRRGEDVISLSSLPEDAKTILCGHIHRKQIIEKRVQSSPITLPVIFSGSIERTSFAEKDEKKGFYHLKFTVGDEGKWILSDLRFFELPSRPMEDFHIDPDSSEQKFIALIQNKIKEIHPDSIIRFKSNKPVNRQLRNILTTKFLSELLPTSLNFTLSPQLFDPETRLEYKKVAP